MKKIIVLSIALFAMFSCTNMLEDDLVRKSSQRVSLTFEGGFAQTKTAFGEDVDSRYDLTWSSGDAIGIFSYDQTETMNDNIKGLLAETSVGMTKGIFIPVNEVTTIPAIEEGADPVEVIDSLTFPVNNNEQFLVYYPYAKGTSINVETNAIDSRLSPVQNQGALGDKQVGKNGFSATMVDVKAGSRNASFTLTHSMAYICFNLNYS